MVIAICFMDVNHSFIHSTNMSSYDEPGTLPGAGDTVEQEYHLCSQWSLQPDGRERP